MKQLDALGKACPTPVIMAKKEIDLGNQEFAITVDNEIAVKNLQKLAENQNYQVFVENKDENFLLVFFGDGSCHTLEVEKPSTENWALFVGKDYIGDGSEELGSSLMKMFFYTLAESGNVPSAILFMNGGVKLPALDEQVVEHLKTLQEKGTEVLVCGTCLKFYEIADQLQTGIVSNMYDISERLYKADKVITL